MVERSHIYSRLVRIDHREEARCVHRQLAASDYASGVSKMANAEMMKRHFAVGDVTGLIGAVEITLNEGLGSGDGPHFVTISKKARAIFEAALNFTGDQAYSLRRNFERAQELNFDLYLREKPTKNALRLAIPSARLRAL